MITTAELRAAMKVPPDEDEELDLLRGEVVELWEQSTGRLWLRREDHVETVLVQSQTTCRINLGLYPVEEIVQVESKGRSGSTWNVLDPETYELLGDRTLSRLSGHWPALVRVTYTGGYVAVPDPLQTTPPQAKTPPDVRRALLVQAEFSRTRTSGDKIALKSEAVAHSGSTVLEEAYLHPYFAKLAAARVRKG